MPLMTREGVAHRHAVGAVRSLRSAGPDSFRALAVARGLAGITFAILHLADRIDEAAASAARTAGVRYDAPPQDIEERDVGL